MQVKNLLFARFEPTIDSYVIEDIKSGKVKYQQDLHDDVVYYTDEKAKHLFAREAWNFYTKPKHGTKSVIISSTMKQLSWLPKLDVSYEVVLAAELFRLSKTYHKKKRALQNAKNKLKNITEGLSEIELVQYYDLIGVKNCHRTMT